MARRTDIIEALVGHLGTNTDVHEFSRDLALFGLSGLKTKLNSIYTALNLSKTWLRPLGLARSQHLLHGFRPSKTTPKGYIRPVLSEHYEGHLIGLKTKSVLNDVLKSLLMVFPYLAIFSCTVGILIIIFS